MARRRSTPRSFVGQVSVSVPNRRAAPFRRPRTSLLRPRPPLTAVINRAVSERLKALHRRFAPRARLAATVRSYTTRLMPGRRLVSIFRPVVRAFHHSPCQTRADRKRVMFARGVAGRRWGSGGGPKPPRFRNEFSNVTCRR